MSRPDYQAGDLVEWTRDYQAGPRTTPFKEGTLIKCEAIHQEKATRGYASGWSVTVKPDGREMVFDSGWFKKPSARRVIVLAGNVACGKTTLADMFGSRPVQVRIDLSNANTKTEVSNRLKHLGSVTDKYPLVVIECLPQHMPKVQRAIVKAGGAEPGGKGKFIATSFYLNAISSQDCCPVCGFALINLGGVWGCSCKKSPSGSDRTCVHCGCTDSHACEGGCSWAETHQHTNTGICSKCLAERCVIVGRQRTEAELLAALKSETESKGQKPVAKRLSITPQFLCDVLRGRRRISANLAGKMGYARNVVFDEVPF